MLPKTHRPRAPLYTAFAVLVVAVGVAVWLLTSGSGGSPSRAASSGPPTTVHVPEPAGPTPSKSAQMVCAPEAEKEIASALGVTTTAPLSPTWVDHNYACRYVYSDGVIGVSVKELSSRAETTTYFDALRSRLGQQRWLKGVAQGAFTTTNGSLVLRKDYKVLLVDTTGLPAKFGAPPIPRKDAAVTVGITVLGCWTGA